MTPVSRQESSSDEHPLAAIRNEHIRQDNIEHQQWLGSLSSNRCGSAAGDIHAGKAFGPAIEQKLKDIN